MDSKVGEDRYARAKREWCRTVASSSILLPELRPLVAEYSVEAPKFRWFGRDTSADLYCCFYRDTSLTVHRNPMFTPFAWMALVVGFGDIFGMKITTPYSTNWEEACLLAETVAEYMNTYRNANLVFLKQNIIVPVVKQDQLPPDFPILTKEASAALADEVAAEARFFADQRKINK